MVLKRYALVCIIAAYMAAIFLLSFTGRFPRPGLYDVSRLIGVSQVVMEGRIADAPVIRWDQTQFVLQGRTSPQAAFEGKVAVTLAFPDEELAPGDTVRLRGWLSKPRQ